MGGALAAWQAGEGKRPQIKNNEMGGALAAWQAGEGKRPLGRPRRRWENNIKVDIWEVGQGAWTGLMWLRKGKGDFKCCNVPLGSIKCGEFFDQLKTGQLFKKVSAPRSE